MGNDLQIMVYTCYGTDMTILKIIRSICFPLESCLRFIKEKQVQRNTYGKTPFLFLKNQLFIHFFQQMIFKALLALHLGTGDI